MRIEKIKIDKNNKIYTLGMRFIYNIEIVIDSTKFYLKNIGTRDQFELTKNVDSLRISEIHLSVMKPKLFKRTNNNQTEICYSFEPNSKSITTTGVVENKNNVWLHPPRSNFFKSLETCPFPYVKLNKPVGYKWTDSMNIGEHWSNKMWGEWKGRLLLKYEYEIIGNETVITNMGKIDCTIIKAVANSNIGNSKLIAYYSDQYGFVILNYTLFNGIGVKLILDSAKKGTILRGPEDFFEDKRK